VSYELSYRTNRERLENVLLIWIYPDVYQNEQIQRDIKYMKQIVRHTFPINGYDECERWLIKYRGDERIVLIVSEKFAKQIVPNIHHLPSLVIIYVYLSDNKIDDKWVRKYSKVCSVVPDMSLMKKRMPKYTESYKLNHLFLYNSPGILHFHTGTSRIEKTLGKSIKSRSGM
jgi:hypothetical protein